MLPGVGAIVLGALAFYLFLKRRSLWALGISALLIFPMGLEPLGMRLLQLPGVRLSAGLRLDTLMIGLGFLFFFACGQPRIGRWALWLGIGFCVLGALHFIMPLGRWVLPAAVIAAGVALIALHASRGRWDRREDE